MSAIKMFLCLFLVITGNGIAQETDFSSEVAVYLERNGTLNQYRFAYDELLKMLVKQYPKSESTTSGWAYLEQNKEKAISEIQQELVPVYQQNFDRSEIQQMTAFYESATGKQLIADRSQMTEGQKEEFNNFYNTELGKKIMGKQAILSKSIAAVSESWSRDLYETALSLVKEQ